MIIDPRHLEHLAIIVDAGTLQHAADQIGTSQPALSRMIKTLEARIGTALFERTTRPLKATPIGIELSHQGRAIRMARLRAIETVDLNTKGIWGILKIGAPPFLCKSLMSEAIASFISARPNIRVDLVPDFHTGLIEKIYRNQIDIIVGPSKFVDRANIELHSETLFNDKIVVVGRAGHPLLQSENLTSADLQNVTWISHSEKSLLLTDMEDALTQLGVRKPRIAFQSDSAGAVLELLKKTDVLSVLPQYALMPDGSDGLAIANISLPGKTHLISMITLANRSETKLTYDFKAHLRDQTVNHDKGSNTRARSPQ